MAPTYQAAGGSVPFAVNLKGSRPPGRMARTIALAALAVLLGLTAPAAAESGVVAFEPSPAHSGGPWTTTVGETIMTVAQAGPSPVQPPVSPVPAPGPIVPRGNPIGTVGIVAMVVVTAAGLWIYRVIRKGL